MIIYYELIHGGDKIRTFPAIDLRKIVTGTNGTDYLASRIYYFARDSKDMIEGVDVFRNVKEKYPHLRNQLAKKRKNGHLIEVLLTDKGVKKIIDHFKLDPETLLSPKNYGKVFGPKQHTLFDISDEEDNHDKKQENERQSDITSVKNLEFSIRIPNIYSTKSKNLLSFNKPLRDYLFEVIPDIREHRMNVAVCENKIIFEFVKDKGLYTIYTSGSNELSLRNNSKTVTLRRELKRNNLSEKDLTDIEVFPESKMVIARF